MIDKPLYPHPYNQTIDVSDELGNDFRCYINSGIMTQYKLSILTTDNQICRTISGIDTIYGGKNTDDSVFALTIPFTSVLANYNIVTAINHGKTSASLNSEWKDSRGSTYNYRLVEIIDEDTLRFSIVTTGNELNINYNTLTYVSGTTETTQIVFTKIDKVSQVLNNGQDYKWKIRLYESLYDIYVTYGTLGTYTHETNKVYLRPNTNIQVGMALRINNQTTYIQSVTQNTNYTYVTVSPLLSAAPIAGDQYKVYCNYIDSAEYPFHTESFPRIDINGIPSDGILATSEQDFSLKYYVDDVELTGNNIIKFEATIQGWKFELYKTTNGVNELIDSLVRTNCHPEYSYDGFLTNNTYRLYAEILSDTEVLTNVSRNITVSYEVGLPPVSPFITQNSRDGSILIDFSQNLSIQGTASGEAGVAYSSTPITETMSGIQINDGHNIYWNEVSPQGELEIDDDKFSLLLRCKIQNGTHQEFLKLESSDTHYEFVVFNGVVRTVSVRDSYTVGYDGTQFYYKIKSAPMITVNPYANLVNGFVSSGTTKDDNTLYKWDDTAVWDDTKIWIDNNIADNDFWLIFCTPTTVRFYSYAKGVWIN